MWVWIAIGLGSSLGLSIVFGVGIAWALSAIGREISRVYELEDWGVLPPTRSPKDGGEKSREGELRPPPVLRLR